MDWEQFFVVHRDLARQGPGAPEDVHWALDVTGVSGAVRVADLGCGPGADLVTLAEALPEAQVTGIEAQADFVASAQAATARFGARVRAVKGDMATPGGPYDMIWCAGALYFLGVTEGLRLWRDVLAPDGVVVFSEPVVLGEALSAGARLFWEEYPQITDFAGIEKRVKDAGYRVVDKRNIIGEPWRLYYDPMKARIAQLRASDPSPALVEMLDMSALEIARWEAARDEIAYCLLVVRPE